MHEHHLGDQHRLRALSRLPLQVGELPAAQARGRAVSDSRTLAPSSATRLSAADRSRSSSTLTSSPSPPRACQGVCPVIRALASASLIRHIAQPPPISLAAISASGTPRPPARFMPTRSRKAPTACRKSLRRWSAFCFTSRSGRKKNSAPSSRPNQTGTSKPQSAARQRRRSASDDRPEQQAEQPEHHLRWPGSSRTTCPPARGWPAARGTPSPARRRTRPACCPADG